MDVTTTRSGLRAGQVVALVLGSLLSIAGMALLTGGGVLIWAHTTQRDASGFYTSPNESLSTGTRALTASIDLHELPGDRNWMVDHALGTVRLRATAAGGDPVFVGIAPTADVDAWLRGVAHAHVTGSNFDSAHLVTTPIAGERNPGSPQRQSFWVASASGAGTQQLRWAVDDGRWTAVVMNPDGAPNVAATVSVGARTGVLLPIGVGLAIAGVLLALGGATLVFFGLREHAMSSIPLEPAGRPGAYPARLDGRLDPDVGRWTWLIKWILVIPHAIVLALLWFEVTLLTVVAGVSILFRGRYPRSIFEFNLGVMRWSWRVAFYTSSAFGTDRYPPFTFHPDPAYPADFEVTYPERLSRPLVLVKWWLLALPHLLIVAILSGGWGVGADGAWRIASGGGLISLLAIIAAIVLAVRGTYPESLFDAVMGFNRWCYRVLAYVALMTDEYPPFRLDTGGDDPGTIRPPLGGNGNGPAGQAVAGDIDLRPRSVDSPAASDGVTVS